MDDDAILDRVREIAAAEGLLCCPEGAATYAAYKQSLADGRVSPTESAVLFNCLGPEIRRPRRDRDPRLHKTDRFRPASRLPHSANVKRPHALLNPLIADRFSPR